MAKPLSFDDWFALKRYVRRGQLQDFDIYLEHMEAIDDSVDYGWVFPGPCCLHFSSPFHVSASDAQVRRDICAMLGNMGYTGSLLDAARYLYVHYYLPEVVHLETESEASKHHQAQFLVTLTFEATPGAARDVARNLMVEIEDMANSQTIEGVSVNLSTDDLVECNPIEV